MGKQIKMALKKAHEEATIVAMDTDELRKKLKAEQENNRQMTYV